MIQQWWDRCDTASGSILLSCSAIALLGEQKVGLGLEDNWNNYVVFMFISSQSLCGKLNFSEWLYSLRKSDKFYMCSSFSAMKQEMCGTLR